MALALGAGPEQLPWIVRAKQDGYRVIALDANPVAQGLFCADQGIVVDIQDVDQVISIARRNSVELTIPSPIGNAIVTLGAVHDALGLPGVSRKSAELCSDKALFSQCMFGTTVNVPREISLTCLEELCSCTTSLQWPMVIKPRFGSGSRGVVVVDEERQIAAMKSNKSLENHYMRGVLAQEFIDGVSLGVDGAVVGEEAIIALIRRKSLTPLPYRVEFQYASPSGIAIDTEARVRSLIQAATKALELEETVFHADLIVRADGEVFLIELSARPSGLMLSSKMVNLATGIDFICEAIRLHAGCETNFSPRYQRPVIVHYWGSGQGTVQAVPEQKALRQVPEVEDVKLGLQLGTRIETPTCVAELLPYGYVVLSSQGDAESEVRMQSVLSSVRIE
jgi:biotin carboxylase